MRTLLTLLALGLSVSICAIAEAQTDVATIVRHVDELRWPGLQNAEEDLRITTMRGARKDEYSYRGYIRLDMGGLMVALDGDTRGQKYLWTKNEFWLYAPRTKRAIRLTPLQAVRGQASVGDLSRLQFGADYDAALATPQTQFVEGQECWVIQLTARKPGATYASVTLYVNRLTGGPVAADVKALSGRALKKIEFGPVKNVGSYNIIATTIYVDALDPSKNTIVTVTALKPAKTPDYFFRPESLPLDK